jgi:hypothetical protein
MKLRHALKSALTGSIVAMIAAVGLVSPAHAESPGRTFDTYIGSVAVHGAFAAQWLNAGSSWFFGNSEMKMQTDGNLVIYHRWTRKVLWATNTYGKGATKMRFQTDGNLVLYKSNGTTAVWASGTYNKCNSFQHSPVIGLQSDGNFVIYCAELRVLDDPTGDMLKALWSPHTYS